MLNLIILILILLAAYAIITYMRLRRAAAKSNFAPIQTGTFRLGDSGKKPFKALLAGDSIAAANGINRFEQSVGGLLAAALSKKHAVTLENRAKNGAKLDDIENQMSGQWDLIVIIGGSNDLIHFRSSARFRNDLTRLLGKAAKLSPRVVFAGPGNIAGAELLPFPYRLLIRPKQSNYQRIVQSVAQQKAVLAVNTKDYLKIGRDPKLVAPDRLHPSAAGHKFWFDMIWPLVHKLVERD